MNDRGCIAESLQLTPEQVDYLEREGTDGAVYRQPETGISFRYAPVSFEYTKAGDSTTRTRKLVDVEILGKAVRDE